MSDCLFACLSVCLSACVSQEPHVHTSPNSCRTLPVAVARSCYGGVGICCMVPAVRETVYRRRPVLPGRRTHRQQQPAGQRDICPVSVNLPSAFLSRASFPDIRPDSPPPVRFWPLVDQFECTSPRQIRAASHGVPIASPIPDHTP